MQKIQGLKRQESLREETGRRAVADARTVDPARGELELVVVEEDRGVREPVPAATRAVDVEFFKTNEAFRMREGDTANDYPIESELVCDEHFACSANRTTTMAHAELCGDDQDVAFLRFLNQIERVRRTSMHPQRLRIDLAFTVVVEAA